MTAEQLKPCPFCGGKAGERIKQTAYDRNGKRWLYYSVWCASCNASTGWKAKKSKAVEAWNRRVNDVDNH